MNNRELEILLDKYITGDLTPAEKVRLAELSGQPAQEEALQGFVRQVMMSDEYAGAPEPRIRERILEHLDKNRVRPSRRLYFLRYAAAAAVVIILAGGAWLWRAKSQVSSSELVQQPMQDVAPGREGAILTLADGKQIVLDSSTNGAGGNGNLAKQGNVMVSRLSGGQLTYRMDNAPPVTSEAVYNTLTTPRGRKTSVVLADGTRVWLNASSSIRFPTEFVENKRLVEISGEVFFEVAKNPGRPFVVRTVHAGSQPPVELQVLGTSFNITAYGDENEVSTTLVDGSVKVISGSATRLVTPGQQIVAKADGRLELNPDVDVQKVIAWKEGNFLFRGDELTAIMKQLSRWYDIEVHFDGTVSDHYTGRISRQVNISQVLKMLQAAGGVSFSVQNKEVRVLPKTM